MITPTALTERALKKPFRTYLKQVPPRTDDEAKRRFRFMASLPLPGERFFRGSIDPDIADEADEEIRWHLVRALRSAHIFIGSVQEVPAKAILNRIAHGAIGAAREEGIAWTPLIDELVRAGVIDAGTWGARDRDPDLGVAIDLARAIAPWVAEQTDPAALHELSVFRSLHVRNVVAENIRVMDDALFDEFVRTGSTPLTRLAANPHLPPAYRERMARETWDEYRKELNRSIRHTDHYDKRSTLKALSQTETGLPADVRHAMITRERRVNYPDSAHIALLISDPGLTEKDIHRLVPVLDGEDAVRVLRLGRDRPADAVRLIMKPRARNALLNSDDAPASLLDLLARHAPADVAVRVAGHRRTGLDTLRWLARTDCNNVEEVLSTREEALNDPDIRACLTKTRQPVIALRLLGTATAEEYPGLIGVIAESSLKEAIESTQWKPPPPGTHFPTDLTARLLTCSDRELRLTVIKLLKRLDTKTPDRPAVTGSGRR